MIRWLLNLFHKRNNDTINEGINVVESIGKAKALYKDLIVKAHPDRNPNKEDLARELTNRINANKFNYRELLRIKQEIEGRLV